MAPQFRETTRSSQSVSNTVSDINSARTATTFFFACATAFCICAAAEQAPKEAEDPERRIQPGDTVSISVFEAQNLSLVVKVPKAGFVMYPLIDRLQLAGRTPEEVSLEVREGLRKTGHLTTASVSVYIAELAKRDVYVMGAVVSARKVEFPRNEVLTVSQAIAVVGGFKPEANREEVKVFRRESGLKVLLVDVEAVLEKDQPALDLELRDGDVVYVTANDFIYVFGHVNSPGAYRLPPGIPVTVSRCVSMAGGFTKFARSNKVRLIRRRADGPEDRMTVLDMRLVIEHGKMEEDLTVSPGDIIFVPESLF